MWFIYVAKIAIRSTYFSYTFGLHIISTITEKAHFPTLYAALVLTVFFRLFSHSQQKRAAAAKKREAEALLLQQQQQQQQLQNGHVANGSANGTLSNGTGNKAADYYVRGDLPAEMELTQRPATNTHTAAQ